MWRGLFGGKSELNSSGTNANSGGEIVENLVERVQTSTTLEDRRDAVKALRSLSKKYRLELGSIGMPALMDVIENDRNHPEVLGMALDALATVISESDDFEGEGEIDELDEKFAEIFVSNKQQMTLIMSLLDDYDFAIRRPIIQIIAGLLKHRASEVQQMIMQDPLAISRLLDMLSEKREVLRNDAILMISDLSKGNPHIQKMLAYGNAFQLLFDVIEHENPDSIVIEDGLFVMFNLLRKNPSNQKHFREASLIARLAHLLHLQLHPDDSESVRDPTSNSVESRLSEEDWSKQKTTNVIFIFQVIRSLVSNENPVDCTRMAQKVFNQCGILDDLCCILLSDLGVSAEVLIEAIIAVSDVIRGNSTNQQHFGSMHLISDDLGQSRKSAILVMLMSMTAEKQPFKLRCAVFYCFQSYLYRNDVGKTEVIRTLLPSSTDSDQSLTAGHYLCSALISHEPVQVWFGAVSLMHCILDASHLKEQLLRVQLATGLGEAPVSLLHQISSQLTSLGNRRPQIRAGLLMLLIVWLKDCPLAVAHFLHQDDVVQYLTANIDEGTGEGSESENQVVKGLCAFLLAVCVRFNDDSVEKHNKLSLSQMMERRLGLEMVAEKIEQVYRLEHYVRANQKPQPQAKISAELLLDYQFTKVFKDLEADLVRLLRPLGTTTSSTQSAQHESVVSSYKELIKHQDGKISTLNQQLKRLENELDSERNEIRQAQMTNEEVVQLKAILKEKCTLLERASKQEMSTGTEAGIKLELEQMTEIAKQWKAEMERYKQFAEQWQQFQIAQLPNANEVVLVTLQQQLKQLEQQLAYGWQAFERQTEHLTNMAKEKRDLETKLVEMKMNEVNILEMQTDKVPVMQQNISTVMEITALKKEQEDLLVLCADQDSKIRNYRSRLAMHGESVTEEENSDDEDDEDERQFV